MTEATVNSPRAAGDPTSLGRSNLNSVFGGGIGRISLIAFAVVLVAMFAYGGYKMFFSRPSLPASASGAPVSTPRAGVHDPMSPVSLEEGGRRAQLNSEVADAATNRGISYVAAPVVMDKRYDVTSDQPVGMTTVADRQPATEMAAAPSPQVGGNGGQGNQQQQQPNPQNQAQLQAEQEMRKAIMEQVGAVMRGSQGGGNQQRSGFFDLLLGAACQACGRNAGRRTASSKGPTRSRRRTQDWRQRRPLAMRLHLRPQVASKANRSSNRATPAMRPWTTASTATTH